MKNFKLTKKAKKKLIKNCVIVGTITAIAIKLVNEFSDSNTRSGSTPA